MKTLLPLPLWTLILTSLHSAHSLSSTSPQDLYAHPRYHVFLSSDPLSNSSASQILSNPVLPEVKYHLMRAKSGQAFLCSVPAPPSPKAVMEAKDNQDIKVTRKQAVADKKAGLERGVALLDPLKGTCLYYRLGWFTCASLSPSSPSSPLNRVT